MINLIFLLNCLKKKVDSGRGYEDHRNAWLISVKAHETLLDINITNERLS